MELQEHIKLLNEHLNLTNELLKSKMKENDEVVFQWASTKAQLAGALSDNETYKDDIEVLEYIILKIRDDMIEHNKEHIFNKIKWHRREANILKRLFNNLHLLFPWHQLIP